MVDYSYLYDNVLTQRDERRREGLPAERLEKLDALYDMAEEDYQLQVVKRSRKYPEVGDVFMLRTKEGLEFQGVVANSHVDNDNGTDQLVVLIFWDGVDVERAVREGVRPEDVLCGPAIVAKGYWTRGFFAKVGHCVGAVSGYGFYDIFPQKFCDEYGNELPEEPDLLSGFGIWTYSGIARDVSAALIEAGRI